MQIEKGNRTVFSIFILQSITVVDKTLFSIIFLVNYSKIRVLFHSLNIHFYYK